MNTRRAGSRSASPKKKPPIGLMPKDIWNQKRATEIAEAMVRYTKAGKRIPIEWIIEIESIYSVKKDD